MGSTILFFHAEEDVQLPWQFFYIRHRVRLGAAAEMEVDLYAAAGAEVWIGESKWWRGRKVGRSEIEVFLRKAELVREVEGKDLQTLRVWFFSHDGFTEEAKTLMKQKGMFWSVRKDIDELLRHVELRQLPDIADKKNRQEKKAHYEEKIIQDKKFAGTWTE